MSTEEKKSKSALNTPGRMLKQARTALGLSPENVSEMLHLSKRQIIAIENDDFGRLPEPTYVRGYLRNYAQLLGLSADTVLESYAQMRESNVTINLGKLARQPEVTSNDRLIQVSTLLVVSVIVGMIVIWWQGNKNAEPPLSFDDAPSAVGEAATENVLLGPEMAAGPATGAPPERAAAESRTDGRKPVAGEDGGAGKPQAGDTAEAPSVSTDFVRQSVTEPAVTADSDDRAAAGPRSRLTLYVNEDSWADIRDAGRNKLLYQTVKAGRVVRLEAAPPISVFLGNADGVKVEYNGVPYDVGRHKRGLIARFTLGADE